MPKKEAPVPTLEGGKLKEEVDFLKMLMAAIVIVLFLGLISAILTVHGMLQSYLATRAAVFQDLVNKINGQNIKIDLLFEELYRTNSKLLEIKPAEIR